MYRRLTDMAEHVLLLTGPPGIGKTTVIRRVAEGLAGRRLGGFYTDEIRVQGQRQGFRLLTFDGRETVIAHIRHPKTYQVGKYGVDVSAIDEIVGHALKLDEHIDVYFVDEIGKMECLSRLFVAAMGKVLHFNKPVVATIALRGTGFITQVKQLPEAQLWELNHKNREDLPSSVIAWLSNVLLM
jgi:nucleoside-triphosphatase